MFEITKTLKTSEVHTIKELKILQFLVVCDIINQKKEQSISFIKKDSNK